MPTILDLTAYQSETFRKSFVWYTQLCEDNSSSESVESVDLSHYTITFTIFNCTSKDVAIQKTEIDGISITGNIIEVVIPFDEINDLTELKYRYNLTVSDENSDGDVVCLVLGDFYVKDNYLI